MTDTRKIEMDANKLAKILKSLPREEKLKLEGIIIGFENGFNAGLKSVEEKPA